MSHSNEAQGQWLKDLFAMGGGAAPAARGIAFADREQRSADSGKVHPKLVPVTDEQLPPVKNLDLPKVENSLVDITDRKSDGVEKMLRSELRELANYVDNGIQSLSALPGDIMNLTVKKMTLTYTGGRTLGIPMQTVTLKGALGLAPAYERQNGFVVPLDAEGEISFDRNNTPNVIICAQWINDEIARRKQIRQEIAELTSTFAGAVAGLGSAASMGGGVPHPQVSGGLPRRGGSRGGGTGVGGVAGPRKGSGSGQGDEAPVPMRLDEGKAPGKAPGKPAGRGGSSGSGGSGGGTKKPPTDPGRAKTDPALPRSPERGRPLDETPAAPGNAKKGPETVDTDSPKGRSGSSGGSAHKPGEVMTPRPVEPAPRLPDQQKINVKTAKGAVEMTVGDYRKRWQDARKWLSEEGSKVDRPKGADYPPELIKQAQEKFGLDKNWLFVNNPYIYGKA